MDVLTMSIVMMANVPATLVILENIVIFSLVQMTVILMGTVKMVHAIVTQPGLVLIAVKRVAQMIVLVMENV